MSEFHKVWIEQCDAAHEIRVRYGVKAAFDYLVGEKLLNFADAATTRPEFARELPRFVATFEACLRREEMRTHIARHRARADCAGGPVEEVEEDDDLFREEPGGSRGARPAVRHDQGIVDRGGAWHFVNVGLKPQPASSTQEVLAGLVERVTFHNAENGFCVLRVKARGQRDLVTVVGHAATIAAGECITASGEWVNDRTHGQQFKARFLKHLGADHARGHREVSRLRA